VHTSITTPDDYELTDHRLLLSAPADRTGKPLAEMLYERCFVRM